MRKTFVPVKSESCNSHKSVSKLRLASSIEEAMISYTLTEEGKLLVEDLRQLRGLICNFRSVATHTPLMDLTKVTECPFSSIVL